MTNIKEICKEKNGRNIMYTTRGGKGTWSA